MVLVTMHGLKKMKRGMDDTV